MKQRECSRYLFWFACFFVLVIAVTDAAFATSQSSPSAPQPPATATTTVAPENQDRKLTRLLDRITEVMDNGHQALYEGLLEPLSGVVSAIIVLYIVLMGIGFTTGMLSIKLSQLSSSMIRIAILAIILSPFSWEWFNYFVVGFFQQITDNLIQLMADSMITQIDPAGPMASANPANVQGPVGPLTPLDILLEKLLRPSNVKIFELMIEHGQHPNAMIGLLSLSALLMLGAVGIALWIYLLIIVATTLLFGLAPVFISCMLFARTRALFYGWLNLIINFTLQPIFLFGFMTIGLMAIEISLFSGDQSLDTLMLGTGNQATLTNWDAIEYRIGEINRLHGQDVLVHLAVLALINFIFMLLMLSVPRITRDIVGRGVGMITERY